MLPASLNQRAWPLYETGVEVVLEAEEEFVGADAFAGATTSSAAESGRVSLCGHKSATLGRKLRTGSSYWEHRRILTCMRRG